MTIAEALLGEFDHEMSTTRQLLELVPPDKIESRPHPKSWTLGELSVHIANLLQWVALTMAETELNLNPPDGDGFTPPTFESPSATVRAFDDNVTVARKAIASGSDADMMVPWTLKNGQETLFTMPRVAVLRSFVMNHLIHHRGQLTIYLRMCDVPLPSVYGPTADSPM